MGPFMFFDLRYVRLNHFLISVAKDQRFEISGFEAARLEGGGNQKEHIAGVFQTQIPSFMPFVCHFRILKRPTLHKKLFFNLLNLGLYIFLSNDFYKIVCTLCFIKMGFFFEVWYSFKKMLKYITRIKQNFGTLRV